MHVETLLLLCSTRDGRNSLRGQGVYEIVKTMHLVEKVDAVSCSVTFTKNWSAQFMLI